MIVSPRGSALGRVTADKMVTLVRGDRDVFGVHGRSAEQRIAIESDAQAAAVMRDAVGEEYKHFAMDLEFLMRRTPVWRETARGILFQEGDIVENGEASEESADDRAPTAPGTIVGSDYLGNGAPTPSPAATTEPGGSLGIGGLKGSRR